MNRKIIMLALLLTLFIVSCQWGSDARDVTDVIRMQYNSQLYNSSVPTLMNLNGILEDMLPEGISVEWSDISSPVGIREAIVTGNIDVGFLSLPLIISSIENKLPISILSNTIYPNFVLYSSREDIKSMDDIKENHKIQLMDMGTIAHLTLMLSSKDMYGDANKFNDNIIVMGNSEMLASFAAADNTLACTIATFPFTLRLDEMDNAFPILDLTPKVNEYGLRLLAAANSDFYNNNPELIEIIYKAIAETIDYMNENPNEAAQVLAEHYGQVEVEDIVELIKITPPSMEISESAYNAVAELMYEVEMLSNPPKSFSELHNYDRIPKVK